MERSEDGNRLCNLNFVALIEGLHITPTRRMYQNASQFDFVVSVEGLAKRRPARAVLRRDEAPQWACAVRRVRRLHGVLQDSASRTGGTT